MCHQPHCPLQLTASKESHLQDVPLTTGKQVSWSLLNVPLTIDPQGHLDLTLCESTCTHTHIHKNVFKNHMPIDRCKYYVML